MDCEINSYLDMGNHKHKPVVYLSQELMENAATVLNINKALKLSMDYQMGTKYYFNEILKQSPQVQPQAGGGKAMSGDGDGEVSVPDHNWEVVDQDGQPTKQSVEASLKAARSQVEAMMKHTEETVTKSRGTVPGELAEILEAIKKIEKPKFNWKGYLRRFIGKSENRYTKSSKFKANLRFPSAPGLKFKEKVHILFAVDCSGSVSTAELLEFQKELAYNAKQGYQITLLQADTIIRSIEPFDPKKPLEIKGRGGTEFNPTIEYYNENLQKYDTLIYFTDGECSCDVKPKGRVLWVHSSRSSINQNLPGEKIKLEI